MGWIAKLLVILTTLAISGLVYNETHIRLPMVEAWDASTIFSKGFHGDNLNQTYTVASISFDFRSTKCHIFVQEKGTELPLAFLYTWLISMTMSL